MAKYEILFACGHTAIIQLYGKHKERYSYIEWCKEHRVCPECYEKAKLEEKEERLAEYKKEAEEAKIEAEAMELPQLEGSEKQINWAMYIRKKLLPVADEAYISLEQNFDLKQYNKEKFLELAKEWLHKFTLQTKASFWIDHRYAGERDLALACAKCVRKKMDEEKQE